MPASGWQQVVPDGYSGAASGRGLPRPREPMQIVSGPVGSEKVHFEAPPSVAVPGEMARFLNG